MADVKPLKLNSGIISQMSSGDTLPVANGGTGATTLTSNGVLLGNSTSAITATTAGTTGQVLVGVTSSAPVFGNWLPIAKYKTAPETVTSSAALQDDDHLFFNIGANEVWNWEIKFRVTANASGGMKWAFTLPSGASGNAAGVGTNNLVQNFNTVGMTTGTGTTAVIANTIGQQLYGTVVNSSNAGTVQFRWAQNASFGTGTTVEANAVLNAWRVS